MAIFTTHLLDGSSGLHACGVPLTLTCLSSGSSPPTLLFSCETDSSGRFERELDLTDFFSDSAYELVIRSGDYWSSRSGLGSSNFMNEIIFRFAMTDSSARYHLPVIMSPHSYSCWWSS